MKKNIGLFLLIMIIGAVLGLLGDIHFEEMRPTYFWPAAVVQSVAGIFFGMPGVLAGAFFPLISSSLRGVSGFEVFLCTFANFAQSYIPYLTMIIFNYKPYEFNVKTLLCFILGSVLLSNIIGGAIAGYALVNIMGKVGKSEYFTVAMHWAEGNIPVAFIFGIILLRFFAPALRECEIYAKSKIKD